MFDTEEIDWTVVILIIVAVVVAAIVLMSMKKKGTPAQAIGQGEEEDNYIVGMGEDYVPEYLEDESGGFVGGDEPQYGYQSDSGIGPMPGDGPPPVTVQE